MTPTEGQHPLRSSGPEEVDPTGIRDLLRALPDPGPMPDDLVERISARLSVEHAHRLQDPGSASGRARDRVPDLTERRSRRLPGRTLAYLGVAAAGLLVATVAVGELAGGGPLGGTAGLDSAAQVSTQSRAAADAGGSDTAEGAGGDEQAMDGSAGGAAEDFAAGGQAGGDADSAGADAAAPSAAAAADPPVEVLPPLGEIIAGAVRSDVLAALARDAVSSPSGGASLSAAGAERCWATGGDGHAWPQRQAAEAVYEGDPVVVLVGRDGDAGSAVLLPASCTDGASVDALEALAWGP